MNVSITEAEQLVLEKSVRQLRGQLDYAGWTAVSHLSRGMPTLRDGAAGAPDSGSLNDLLNGVVKTPGATSIVVAPEKGDISSAYNVLMQVQTLDSLISVLTAYCIYNEHPEPYDTSKPEEASAFIRATAKWRNYVISGGNVKALASYLTLSSSTSQTLEKNLTSGNLHLEFLGALFADFNFPAKVLSQLDGILTRVFEKLSSINFSFENQTDTFDHVITMYSIEKLEIEGGSSADPALYVPKMRVFYLKIDRKTWQVTILKSDVQNLNFKMSYFDAIYSVNSAVVASQIQNINQTIATLTGKTTSEINQVMNMQAVQP
jgi:hypothetical protein